jgi:hypothetical protein
MIFRRKPRLQASTRPSDDWILGQLLEHLAMSAPDVVLGSTVRGGVLHGGEGWELRLLANHTDSPTHVDLGFSVGGSDLLIDCVSGIGPWPGAMGSIGYIWHETSGAVLLEMLTGDGKFAGRWRPGEFFGLPNWHTITSGVIAYGRNEDDNHAMQMAMATGDVLKNIAPHLTLPRARDNGIKLYYFRTPNDAIADAARVKIFEAGWSGFR